MARIARRQDKYTGENKPGNWSYKKFEPKENVGSVDNQRELAVL